MKTRFCPSPTGYIHLGNVRTALFNALLAYHQKGIFLLRIEDTDRTRSDEKYTHQLMEDLHWLGLDWQEGPELGGENGPYWQSQRQKLYDEYYQKLIFEGGAYPCFCSESKLKMMRKLQLASGKPPRYDGTCRKLSEAEVQKRLDAGELPTLRFKVPEDQTIEFHDLVKGQQRFAANDIGDFIIRRTDGTPPFMFCNAVDDALMKVTHVMRGEDHLTNTPRQIMILRTLGLPEPSYAHISLIVSNTGGPLSKRLGSLSIDEMREKGYFPLAVLNYLGRLGHHYSENHLLAFDELVTGFEVTSLGGAPARFDMSQLLHWQKCAVLQADVPTLWKWFGPEVVRLVPPPLVEAFTLAVQPNCLFPEEAHEWAKSLFATCLEYDKQDIELLKSVPEGFYAEASENLNGGTPSVKTMYGALSQKFSLKGPAVYKPLRVALTGKSDGPELAQLFELMGAERMQSRFKQVKQFF